MKLWWAPGSFSERWDALHWNKSKANSYSSKEKIQWVTKHYIWGCSIECVVGIQHCRGGRPKQLPDRDGTFLWSLHTCKKVGRFTVGHMWGLVLCQRLRENPTASAVCMLGVISTSPIQVPHSAPAPWCSGTWTELQGSIDKNWSLPFNSDIDVIVCGWTWPF